MSSTIMAPTIRAHQTGTFSRTIPAERLALIACYKGSNPSMVVRMKPESSLSPRMMSLAMTPAIKPMMIVQIMLIYVSP